MLDDQGLFRSGPSTILELSQVVGRLVALRGCECTLRVRVVAVPDESGGWQLFAGRLALLEGEPEPSGVVALGPLRLVTSSIPADAVSEDPETLRSLLLSWLVRLGLDRAKAAVQESLQVDRTGSESADRPPLWRCELYQHRGQGFNAMAVPVNGPFVDESLGLLARTTGELAAQWLDLPFLWDRTAISSTITLTLADPRQAFAEVAFVDEEIALTVRSAGAPGSVQVLAFLTDSTGQRHQARIAVHEGSARVPMPGLLRAMQFFLVDAMGTTLDEFYEDEHRCSRNTRLLYSARTGAEDALCHALESGEGDQIEFKEWLPLDRSKGKSLELFKTVCAFANASGGTLFIGVADDLRLLNLDANIRSAVGHDGGPIEGLRERYRLSLLQLLRQGIAPNVQVEAEWVVHAGLSLLRVAVAASLTRTHYVVEDRTSYVRRGASCAKATPADLALTALAPLSVRSMRRHHLGP